MMQTQEPPKQMSRSETQLAWARRQGAVAALLAVAVLLAVEFWLLSVVCWQLVVAQRVGLVQLWVVALPGLWQAEV